MSQIVCGRGHLYDPELHTSCPYCNTNRQIPIGAAGRIVPLHMSRFLPFALAV